MDYKKHIKEYKDFPIDGINYLDLNPIYKKDRPQEVFLANCSAQKARKLFNYKTKYTLKKGLNEMIEYIKNKGVRKFKYHLDLEIVNKLTPVTWKNKIF